MGGTVDWSKLAAQGTAVGFPFENSRDLAALVVAVGFVFGRPRCGVKSYFAKAGYAQQEHPDVKSEFLVTKRTSEEEQATERLSLPSPLGSGGTGAVFLCLVESDLADAAYHDVET